MIKTVEVAGEKVKVNTDRNKETFLLVHWTSKNWNLLVHKIVYMSKAYKLRVIDQKFTCPPDNCQYAFYLSTRIIACLRQMNKCYFEYWYVHV